MYGDESGSLAGDYFLETQEAMFVDELGPGNKYVLLITSEEPSFIPSERWPTGKEFIEELRAGFIEKAKDRPDQIEPRMIEVGGEEALESGSDTYEGSAETTYRIVTVVYGSFHIDIVFNSTDSRDKALSVFQGILDSVEFKD